LNSLSKHKIPNNQSIQSNYQEVQFYHHLAFIFFKIQKNNLLLI